MSRASQVVIVACAGALVACYKAPVNGPNHVPTTADWAAWDGVPVIELEKHYYLSTVKRDEQELSDGTTVWTYTTCKAVKQHDASCRAHTMPVGDGALTNVRCSDAYTTGDCCKHQFMIKAGAIEKYRTSGDCFVNCGIWPEAKTASCNAARE